MKPNRIISLFTFLIIVILSLTYNSCRIKEETTVNSGGGIPCPSIPTVEYGGQTYNTVLIGDQCWLKENLNIGTQIIGSQTQPNNGTIVKYCYDNNEANCNTYGGLYKWNEMMQHSTVTGAQGICPNGWHIPTEEEWTTLTDFLGGISVAGGKMKSTSGWNDNGNGSNNSGFTALPAGYLTHIPFLNLTDEAHFWSSSDYHTIMGAHLAKGLKITCGSEHVLIISFPTIHGNSCRCLKD